MPIKQAINKILISKCLSVFKKNHLERLFKPYRTLQQAINKILISNSTLVFKKSYGEIVKILQNIMFYVQEQARLDAWLTGSTYISHLFNHPQLVKQTYKSVSII